MIYVFSKLKIYLLTNKEGEKMSMCLTSGINKLITVLQSLSTDNKTTIIAAIIAVIGVFLGAVLSFISQIILNSIINSREKKKVVLKTQLQIFPLVLKYVVEYSKLCEMKRKNKSQESIRLQKEITENIFIKFYSSFYIICKAQTLNQYNKLIEDIENGCINQNEAIKRTREMFVPYFSSKRRNRK